MKGWQHRVLQWVLVIAVALGAGWGGLRLRAWVWENSESIRWNNINNALAWGSRVLDGPDPYNAGTGEPTWGNLWAGYRTLYDAAVDNPNFKNGQLDYAPGRLLAVAIWVRQTRQTEPGAYVYQPEYAQFMLNLNTLASALAAVAALLLVRHWLIADRTGSTNAVSLITGSVANGCPSLAGAAESTMPCESGDFASSESEGVAPAKPQAVSDPSALAPSPGTPGEGGGEGRRGILSGLEEENKALTPPSPGHTGRGLQSPQAACHHWLPLIAGLISAVLLWFNAAILLEGYAWPQWDVWPVPFYLFAVYMASTNRWGRAGAIMGFGALFKGQILFALPFLVLWALFQIRFIRLGRLLFGLGVAMVTRSPWTVRVLCPFSQFRFIALGRLVIGVAAAAMLGGSPWLVRGFWPQMSVYWATVLPAVGAWFLWRRLGWRVWVRRSLTAAALSLAISVALTGRYSSNASMAWFKVGYVAGTEKFPLMARNAACNLPAILQQNFGWQLRDRVFAGDNPEAGMTIKTFLLICYGVTVVLSAGGAAIHAQRRSRWFLVSAVAPWVMLFTLVTQMDGRYLLYAAATSAVFAGVGVGFTMLHVLLTAMNLAMMFKFLVDKSRSGDWSAARQCLSGIEPGMGWALIVVALVILWGAVMPRRRSV